MRRPSAGAARPRSAAGGRSRGRSRTWSRAGSRRGAGASARADELLVRALPVGVAGLEEGDPEVERLLDQALAGGHADVAPPGRAEGPGAEADLRASRSVSPKRARPHAGESSSGFGRHCGRGDSDDGIGWTDAGPRAPPAAAQRAVPLGPAGLAVPAVPFIPMAIVLDLANASQGLDLRLLGAGDHPDRGADGEGHRGARRAVRPRNRWAPERHLRQRARADHRAVRARTWPPRGRQGVPDRLDPRQPPPGDGRLDARGRPGP